MELEPKRAFAERAQTAQQPQASARRAEKWEAGKLPGGRASSRQQAEKRGSKAHGSRQRSGGAKHARDVFTARQPFHCQAQGQHSRWQERTLAGLAVFMAG